MKHIIGMLVVFCCLISFSAGPAEATIKINDQISVKGQMRFRFWDKSNVDYNDDDTKQYQYWDERFRLSVNFKESEGMSAHLRFDLNDAQWGSDTYKSSRWSQSTDPGDGSTADHDDTIEVGRAYLVVTQPQFKIVGGLNYWELGNRLTYENTGTGFTIESTQLPVTLKFGFVLEDELGSRDDIDGDQSNYYFQVDTGKMIDNHLFKFFYANADDNAREFDAWVFGVSAKGNFLDKKLSYKTEFDILGGEEEAGQDIFGQQFWLELAYKVNKKFTFGGHFVYAKGSDDEDKDQYDSIHDARADNWDIQTYGPFKTVYAPLGMADVLDPEGQNTGAIAGALFGKYKLFEKLETYFQYLYVKAESNDLDSQTFQNATIASLAVRYYFTKKVQFACMYGHSTMDVEDSDVHDDPEQVFGAMLRVSF